MDAKRRRHYKYIALNSESSEETENRINAAAAEGFTVDHVVQGYQRGTATWNYAGLVMSKDAVPVSSKTCPGCDECRGDDVCMVRR